MSDKIPPEKCPVCGAETMLDEPYFKSGEVIGLWSRDYTCGASFFPNLYLDRPKAAWKACPHAMTAAIRCHATLEPTPLEQARDALLAAAVEYDRVIQAYPYGTQTEEEGEDADVAAVGFIDALVAYLDALEHQR